MIKQYKAVGVFPNRRETEIALRELIKKHGFPAEQVSVIAQHLEQSDINEQKKLEFPGDRIFEGGYLVVVEGTTEEIQLAKEILHQHDIAEWEVYDAVEIKTKIKAKSQENHDLRILGTFPHLTEAKTAVIELIEISYPLNQIILYINDSDRHDWFPDLKVSDRLDDNFARIPPDRKLYFQDSLDLGQYILVVTGTETELQRAETVLRLKGIQGFYTYNPHEREVYRDSISTTQSPPLVKIIDLCN